MSIVMSAHTICCRLPRQIALDDVNAQQELEDFAMSLDLTDTFNFVDKHFVYDAVRLQFFSLH